jgi:[protein-PII] uridylyltransferase
VAGPPRIVVDNQLSDVATVVEVKCPDRVGLLYLITATLAALGLDITSARIATEIDKAVDTFYVTNGQGQKIEDTGVVEQIRASLRDALARPL